MKIYKGDMVKIVSGNDKGKTGRVIKVFPDKNRIIVEGVNVVKKHSRPSQENPQGGIVEKELSVHLSNLSLVHKGKKVKVGFKMLENGKKVRINKLNGSTID